MEVDHGCHENRQAVVVYIVVVVFDIGCDNCRRTNDIGTQCIVISVECFQSMVKCGCIYLKCT